MEGKGERRGEGRGRESGVGRKNNKLSRDKSNFTAFYYL